MGYTEIIQHEHEQVHRARSWIAEDTSSNMGAEAGDFISLDFTTPAATRGLIHMLFDGYCSGAFTFTLMEAGTKGAGGTAVVAYNRWRPEVIGISDGNPAKTEADPLTLLKKDHAIMTSATTLFTRYYGAGQGVFAVGGDARGENEWVLKPSTAYHIQVYNAAATTGAVRIHYYADGYRAGQYV